jgi:hypothetical protein
MYAEWDTDIDMRTIFYDGSSAPNARDISRLYTSSGQSNGTIESLYEWSPNNQAKVAFSYSFSPTVHGLNFPWMLDNRVKPGNFAGRSYTSGSVPAGWLNGVSGSNAANEFLTSGSSFGPEYIRPVYPILDDVYVEKIYDKASSNPSYKTVPSGHKKICGFRPGLRGTQLQGKWKLMIGVASSFNATAGMVGNIRAGIWFRQFRLEFIVDENEDINYIYPSRKRLYEKTTYVPQKDGKRNLGRLSGSASWDIGVNRIFCIQSSDYGRSVGITDLTASSNDFAVFSRMTGALADRLTGSNVTYAYLHNEFGTPYIPISSGSGLPLSFNFFTKEDAGKFKNTINGILNPKPKISQSNTMYDTVTRTTPALSTRNKIYNDIELLYPLPPKIVLLSSELTASEATFTGDDVFVEVDE